MSNEKYNFSKGKNMWLFTTFDLPTATKSERHEYAIFRRKLLALGFSMLQFSVYAKFCQTRRSAAQHQKWVKEIVPPRGEVRTFMVTDMQYLQMQVFRSETLLDCPPEEKPEQIMLF